MRCSVMGNCAPESITNERPRERPAVLRLSTGSDQRAFGVMTKPWAAESAAARQTRRRRRAILRLHAYGVHEMRPLEISASEPSIFDG